MSSFNRRHMLLAPLALAACGFTPVYGPGGTGMRLRNQIQLGTPEDRTTYLLQRRLEERLGRATNPSYKLALALTTEQSGLAIDPDGNIDRFNLIGSVQYTLTDLDGGVLVSGEVNSFTSFSTTGSTGATLAAERDANKRLMVILADQITARLLSASLPE